MSVNFHEMKEVNYIPHFLLNRIGKKQVLILNNKNQGTVFCTHNLEEEALEPISGWEAQAIQEMSAELKLPQLALSFMKLDLKSIEQSIQDLNEDNAIKNELRMLRTFYDQLYMVFVYSGDETKGDQALMLHLGAYRDEEDSSHSEFVRTYDFNKAMIAHSASMNTPNYASKHGEWTIINEEGKGLNLSEAMAVYLGTQIIEPSLTYLNKIDLIEDPTTQIVPGIISKEGWWMFSQLWKSTNVMINRGERAGSC